MSYTEKERAIPLAKLEATSEGMKCGKKWKSRKEVELKFLLKKVRQDRLKLL